MNNQMNNTWDGFGQGLIKKDCPVCGSDQIEHLDSNSKYAIVIAACPSCKSKFEFDFDEIWPLKADTLKEECNHEHLCCPGGIKTLICAYCAKKMYKEPSDLEQNIINALYN